LYIIFIILLLRPRGYTILRIIHSNG